MELSVRTCPPGNPLEGAAEQEVEAEEVSPDAAPALPRNKGSINDNYCVMCPVPMARPVLDVLSVERRFCICSTTCVVSCCQSCTFCLKCERAVAKERRKSLIKSEHRNKFCEKCFFCRSFLPPLLQMPQCCQCTAGRRAPPKVLAEMVPPGCKSESSVYLEGGVHSPVQKQTTSSE